MDDYRTLFVWLELACEGMLLGLTSKFLNELVKNK